MNDLITFLAARIDEDERELVKDPPIGLGYANLAARMRREVGAMRTILAEHEHRTEHEGNPERGFGCDTCHFDREYGFAPGIDWCRTLRALAAIWNDHPDYRAEWKP